MTSRSDAPLPVVVLPFEALVSDNVRHGNPGAIIRLTTAYRYALTVVATIANQQWRRPPLDGPLALTAQCHFPDRRRRDVVNYHKLIGDALSGVCWQDDAQLCDVRYVRASIDRAQPRVELTISPITP